MEIIETTFANCEQDPLRFSFHSDPWVLYHGTSSIFETQIDSDGLRPSGGLPICQSDVEALINVFRLLGWPGDDPGGYGVLGSYSRMRHQASKWRCCLTSYPNRGLLYAMRDFAGGETARACRRAFPDLDRFLADASARQNWIAERRSGSLWSPFALPPTAAEDYHPDTLAAAREAVSSLAALRKIVNEAANKHSYGVVYAIRLQLRDMPVVRGDSTPYGLSCLVALGPERIMGKAVVLDEREIFTQKGDAPESWRLELPWGPHQVMQDYEKVNSIVLRKIAEAHGLNHETLSE